MIKSFVALLSRYRVGHFIDTMPAQAKISSFLKPIQNKRANEEVAQEKSHSKMTPKKCKLSPMRNVENPTDSFEAQENIQSSPPLTPGEKKNMTNNPPLTPGEKKNITNNPPLTPEEKKNITNNLPLTPEEKKNITNSPPLTPGEKKNITNSPPLTPEEKKNISDSKDVAKIKMAAKQSHGLVVHIGSTWFKALEPQFSKPYFTRLCKFVEGERAKNTIYPPASQVWSWTNMCDISDVKVVILGQDPYHGEGQAHGLCFSVQTGVKPPPSLLNMYKELETDIPGFTRPTHGTLNGWSKQGVLLLNAVLTVQAHKANSHKDKGWEMLTDSVISWLNNHTEGIVFLLWGSYAQKKGGFINKTRHRVLSGVHPSPLSAHRGFFGCKHFSKCNELLAAQGKSPIDWTDLPV